MSRKSKYAQFEIVVELHALGANTPDFQHSGYRETFTVHVDNVRVSFQAKANSIKQAKVIASATLRRYFPSSEITGSITYHVEPRIAQQWICANWRANGGHHKRGTLCSPREYKSIKRQQNLLNSGLFAFTDNDATGRGLGTIVPFTGEVWS